MIAPQTAASSRWLSIVGIGEDGVEGLGSLARAQIASAAVVFGGARHLAHAASLIRGVTRPWNSPFAQAVAEVLAYRGQPVCVLASGDPFHYGVGSLLAARVPAEEILSIPAISAFSLAASRLRWALQDTVLLSLCGRPLDSLRPHLHPGTRILALMSDQHAPARLAQRLCELGFGGSQLTVLEALGGSRETIRRTRADAFALDAIDPLNTLAIEVHADAGARILSRAPGLADELYEHDGQITKREVRALTLSALAPRRGERLWDIGAGSGSVSIEWLLADRSLSAIAIEQHAERAARIRRNAETFGVAQLQLVEGAAPEALAGLPTPDAVFIGGGSTRAGLIEQVQAALRPGGRLVINAVSLASEALLLQLHARCGGSLTRIEIARAAGIGGDTARLSGWRPAMPICQWFWVKP